MLNYKIVKKLVVSFRYLNNSLLKSFILLVQENVSVSNISESIFNYVAITTDNDTIMYQQIVTYFENFTNGIYDRKNNYRYTGQNCITSPEWTFCASLIIAITVITLNGYSFIAPVTL